MALVGNKCDLRDRRAVERSVAEATAEEIGAVYYETSAATGEAVEEVFAALARAVMEEDAELEREQAAMEGPGSGGGPGAGMGAGGDDRYGGVDSGGRAGASSGRGASSDRVDLSGAKSAKTSGGGGCGC